MKSLNLSEVPSSVYRLQLNVDFPLKKAIKILSYLKDLGIEGVYCSPFYDADSSHGYDIADPNCLNPKIGTPKEYLQFCNTLKKLGLKQIIDVVPNHMGFKKGKNKWWQDVLEHGPKSKYAPFFDIDWNPEKVELRNRVLLPILSSNYGTALENQEIKLHYDRGRFWLQYADYLLPIAPHTYEMILEGLEQTDNKGIQKVLDRFNGTKHSPKSFDFLDRLLEAQYYRLAYWKVANHEINYRRFFNIHELVAIRIEEKQVLEAHHHWLFKLIEDGDVQGLRVDHPDGLYDPTAYFDQLRERYPIYTVVEKILDRKEQLPENWQVEGTVGYEYLNVLNGVFVNQVHERAFNDIYKEFLGYTTDFEEIVYRSKKNFALHEMVSEVEALSLSLDRLSEHSRHHRDFTRHDLTKALVEVIACFPVYRTYITPEGRVNKCAAHYLNIAINEAKQRATDLNPSLFDFLEKLFYIKLRNQKTYREFVLRFQQLTAPVMAKGLEDTAFYVYNRFISLNEVGGDPSHFGYSVSDFHHFNQEKLKKWPLGFLSSSTHDTKRSEDVRLRLNALSEIPEQWRLEAREWAKITSKFKKAAPCQNTEYFIYQLLIGAWPRHTLKSEEYQPLAERLWGVILKSIREAKQETNWMFPNMEYEEAVRKFLFTMLAPDESNLFLKRFIPFQKQIDRFGAFNSFSATVLKIASCGVVDLYQGNELLNYSLVDPDNRYPVDFDFRKKELAMIKRADPAKLAASHDFSRLKGFLHWKALHFRREHSALLLEGRYLPLEVRGQKKEHLIAFLRFHKKEALIVLAGRFFASLGLVHTAHLSENLDWGDTEVILPKEWEKYDWTEIFMGRGVQFKSYRSCIRILVLDIFKKLSVGYIYGKSSS